VLDTPTSWLDKFSSVWLVGGYYHGSIDGASGNGTRKAIRDYEHARGLPVDGRIGQRLLMTMGFTLRTFLSHPSPDDRQNHREVSMMYELG
jgi:peptidoglycan hydrolase-like protein with peptidoglycan-binding domain